MIQLCDERMRASDLPGCSRFRFRMSRYLRNHHSTLRTGTVSRAYAHKCEARLQDVDSPSDSASSRLHPGSQNRISQALCAILAVHMRCSPTFHSLRLFGSNPLELPSVTLSLSRFLLRVWFDGRRSHGDGGHQSSRFYR